MGRYWDSKREESANNSAEKAAIVGMFGPELCTTSFIVRQHPHEALCGDILLIITV